MANITDEQVQALRDEARERGDEHMECVCIIALDGYLLHSGFRGASQADMERLATMTRNEARAKCARVIGDAQAQEG